MDTSKIPLGLLRFCLQHGDDLNTSNLPQRDPKDYEWLKEALGGLENDVDVMKKLIAKLQEPETMEEQRRVLMKELQYLVEDIDNANELHKIGGLELVIRFLKESEDEVTRMWSAWILTSLVQNNPKGVFTALENGGFDAVMGALAKETNSETRVKLLSAVSAFLSDNPQIARLFLARQGLELLQRSLAKESSPREQLRALVILNYIVRHLPERKDTIRDLGILTRVVEILKETGASSSSQGAGEESEVTLKALALLSELVREHPENWKHLTTTDDGLSSWLQQHITSLLNDRKNSEDPEFRSHPLDPLWYSLLKQLRTQPTQPQPAAPSTPTTQSPPLLLL